MEFQPKYIYFLPIKCFVNYHLQHSWHFLALTLSPVNLRISFEATSQTGPMMLSWWRHQMKNIFRVTGPFWVESTGHRWIPLTKASDAELLICAWTNNWANNRDAGYLRHHHVHYDVTVMLVNDINTTKQITTKQFAFVIVFIIPYLMQHNYRAPLGCPCVINCSE